MPKKITMEIPEGFVCPRICAQSPDCGGCSFDGVTYAGERTIKERRVLDLLDGAGVCKNFEYAGLTFPDDGGVYEYRNKMEFSFGDSGKGGELRLGMRKRGSRYEVADASCCRLCDGDFRAVVVAARKFFAERGDAFYNTTRHTGVLRSLIVRKSYTAQELLINVVTASGCSDLRGLVEAFIALPLEGRLAGVIHTVCDGVADVVKPDRAEVLFGRDWIFETVLGLRFKITPHSFFQTNTAGAARLYGNVADWAAEVYKGGAALDLYCGTGAIAQVLAARLGNDIAITGVEIVEEAVGAAVENAADNGLSNCRFLARDVKDAAAEMAADGVTAGLVVVDPPRAGLHPSAVVNVAKFNAPFIIYVSCNPVTLARDLGLLAGCGYAAAKIAVHDMFPRADHVETVCLLRRGG